MKDPISRCEAGDYEEVAAAYVRLLRQIDEIVLALGGDHAARAVVSYAAREAVSDAKGLEYERQRGGDLWHLGLHLTLCDVFVISAKGLNSAADQVRRAFEVQGEQPVERNAPFAGGDLTIRGERMYFEAGGAAVLLGHCFKDKYHRPREKGDERWITAVTKEAGMVLDLNKLEKPSLNSTHSKSRQAAVKGLMRVARDWFKADMKPVESLISSA